MNLLKEHKWLVVLCSVFFVAGVLRLNDLSLYTDSSRYLIWGTSFAHLKEFVDDTQPEPDRYVVNAPLYAVLIAPPLLVFPFSVTAAKVWTLLWACCALVLFYVFLLRLVGRSWAVVGVFLLAVNPLMLIVSTEVLSEAAFLVFLLFILILAENVFKSEPPARGLVIILLLCTGLVVILREVAVTLIGALLLTFAVRGKTKLALMVLAAAAFMYVLWLVRNLVLVGENPSAQSSNIYFIFQHALTPANAPLFEEIAARVRSNISGFGLHLGGMLLYSFPPNLIVNPGSMFRVIISSLSIAKYAVIPVVSSLVLLGIIVDLRTSSTALVRFLFVAFYIVVILTYPIHDIRFLLPLLPFMIFYVLKSVVWGMGQFSWTGGIVAQRLPAIAIVVFMVPNLVSLGEILRTNLSYRLSPLNFYEQTIQTNPEKTHFFTPWSIVGNWFEKHSPENTVIASSAKELAGFVGKRRVLEINSGVPLPVFEFLLRDNAADYVLATGLWSDLISYEFLMKESARFWFEPVFRVASLHVFKVHSRYLNITHSPRQSFEYDTTTSTGLLRKGRLELLTENYTAAIQSLEKASRLQPNQPEPIFQLFLTHAFRGDSAKAIEQVRKMFTRTRSTPYVWAAQIHLQAMNQLNQSKSVRSTAQRSTQFYDVARLYWNLGFRRQAYRIMREAVGIDSSYFVGLLWSWHYATQIGDTTTARTFLRKLESIDPSNAVVVSFRTMSALADTLRKISSPAERSRLRLLIARQYEKMELPEDCIDEAERAAGEDPSNPEAWKFLAGLFEGKGKMRAAQKASQHLQQTEPASKDAKSLVSEAQRSQ